MFRKVDCIRVSVPDVEEALGFYRDKLRLKLIWKRGSDEAGLGMSESETEIVLVREKLDANEVDILVESATATASELERLGGKVVVAPFEISIGNCAVVADPWGNRFVILDMVKGPLRTDERGQVVGD